jgi:hypothetical protein
VQAGDAWRLDHPGDFQFNRLMSELLEQAPTLAQQLRDEVRLDLVEQPGL